MQRSNLLYPLVIVLILSSLACMLPGLSIANPNAISTAAAQTVIVQLTVYAPSPIFVGTFTPGPTLTPWPTLTATATPLPIVFPTFTPSYPFVSVSIPANCRSGPGTVYAIVGYFMVGETAQVYGRGASGLYWYIRNPDNSSSFCWISGKYAALSGNLSTIPIYTAWPTPTSLPNISIDFVGLDSCQNWWTEFKLTNNTSNIYKSVSITVFDSVTGKSVLKTTDGFLNQNGCLVVVPQTNFLPGSSLVVSAQPFGYDPSGNKLRATIKLCTKKGLSGSCISSSIVFTP
jgi:uncharacterized protein YraI